jgi:hypothetical protein
MTPQKQGYFAKKMLNFVKLPLSISTKKVLFCLKIKQKRTFFVEILRGYKIQIAVS